MTQHHQELSDDMVNDAVRAYIQAGKRGISDMRAAMRCALESAILAATAPPDQNPIKNFSDDDLRKLLESVGWYEQMAGDHGLDEWSGPGSPLDGPCLADIRRLLEAAHRGWVDSQESELSSAAEAQGTSSTEEA